MGKLTGKVLWFSDRDRNGIIVENSTGNEFYVDISVIKDRQLLKRKDQVTFILNESIKDCRCAKDVEIL